MRAVVQRVIEASVEVEGVEVGGIGEGLLVLLAIEASDTARDIAFMRRKIQNLRIFNDDEGKMNRSVRDVGGRILLVSQFTLYGDCRKGNRPSFVRSASPQKAEGYYGEVADGLRKDGIEVETGVFQAMMQVSLINSGPVTLIVDSRKEFY